MSRRDALILWLAPLGFVLVLFALRAASLPFWQAFNLDPDYYYLLNGLRIVEGLAPTDVSHPGTPIQVLIAAVIRAMHPLAPTSQVVDAVLGDPEGTLIAATSVIYGMVGLSLWVLGRAAYAWGGLGAALLAQSSPFLARIIPKMALHPKPEPFLVIAVALLAAICLAVIKQGGGRDRHAVAAGVVVGFGIACKIHFAALGLVPILLFDRRRLALYIGASITGFLVFFATALPSLDIWLDWLRRMALGSGAYGTGAQTVIDPGRYPHAVIRLFAAKWFFTGAFAASLLILLAYARLRRRGLLPADPAARLLAGILMGQFATILLIAKAPAPHYMVPPMMLTGPTLALLWRMSRPILPAIGHRRLWALVAAAALVAPAIGMVQQWRELRQWSAATQAMPMGRFAACAKIYFDAASAPSFAFQRGDLNAQGRYSPKLAKLFPADEYSLFVADHTWWKHGLMRWNQRMELDDVLGQYACAVFRGNQYPQFQVVMAGRHFDDVCSVGEEKIFTIGVTCAGDLAK